MSPRRPWQHLQLLVIPMVAGFVIAFALAVLAMRRPGTVGPVTAVTGLLYTIPSLAAFAVLIPITGLSLVTAIIPLTTYTLLILYVNTVAGLRSVPPEVNEAADAMGYTAMPRGCWRVQLPLAVPAHHGRGARGGGHDHRPGDRGRHHRRQPFRRPGPVHHRGPADRLRHQDLPRRRRLGHPRLRRRRLAGRRAALAHAVGARAGRRAASAVEQLIAFLPMLPTGRTRPASPTGSSSTSSSRCWRW